MKKQNVNGDGCLQAKKISAWTPKISVFIPVGMRTQWNFLMGMKLHGYFLSLGKIFWPIFPVSRGIPPSLM